MTLETEVVEIGSRISKRVNEIAGIEKALDVLLRSAIAADRTERRSLRVMSLAEIEPPTDKTKAGVMAEQIVDRPIGEACRQAIRTLGKRLHEIGGARLMQSVCERVAESDPSNAAHRTDIMDKRWDGIGEWAS